jgi:hypothetical protein
MPDRGRKAAMTTHRHRPVHAEAAEPTLSLLRLSAWQRLVGAGIILGVLWGLVIAVLA